MGKNSLCSHIMVFAPWRADGVLSVLPAAVLVPGTCVPVTAMPEGVTEGILVLAESLQSLVLLPPALLTGGLERLRTCLRLQRSGGQGLDCRTPTHTPGKLFWSWAVATSGLEPLHPPGLTKALPPCWGQSPGPPRLAGTTVPVSHVSKHALRGYEENE